MIQSSCLEFRRTTPDQICDFLWLYCCARVCVVPALLRVGLAREVVEASLLLFGFTLAIFAPYPRKETRHGDTELMQCSGLPFQKKKAVGHSEY